MADADFRRADAYSFLDATNRENEEPLLDGEFFRDLYACGTQGHTIGVAGIIAQLI